MAVALESMGALDDVFSMRQLRTAPSHMHSKGFPGRGGNTNQALEIIHER